MANLDTAIEISVAASKVDCARGSEDLFAASPSDVIQLIAEARVAGRINDCVIYLLARLPVHALIERRRRLSEIAKRPRRSRVDASRIIEIGRTLQDRGAHEIVGIVWQRLDGEVSQATVRKHLRTAGIIPPSEKKGS
jgi:hypothetical protein